MKSIMMNMMNIIKATPKVQQRTLGINILAFADTHYDFTNRETIERLYQEYGEPDIVMLLGDHHPYFIDLLLQYYPENIILGVLGNHDLKSLYRKFGLKELHGNVASINGITIAGISGSHKYKCNSNYLLLSQDESLEICEMLLKQAYADILISHDKAFFEETYDVAHCGMAGITKYIFSEKAPIVHIHGHLHRSYKKYYLNGTKEISVYGVEYLKI